MNKIITFLLLYLTSVSLVFAGGDDRDSVLEEYLDLSIIYDTCNIDDERAQDEIIYFKVILADDVEIKRGEVFYSESAAAIAASYNKDDNSLTYFQNSDTGYGSFVMGSDINIGDTLTTIKEIVIEVDDPCVEKLVVEKQIPINKAVPSNDYNFVDSVSDTSSDTISDISSDNNSASCANDLECEKAKLLTLMLMFYYFDEE